MPQNILYNMGCNFIKIIFIHHIYYRNAKNVNLNLLIRLCIKTIYQNRHILNHPHSLNFVIECILALISIIYHINRFNSFTKLVLNIGQFDSIDNSNSNINKRIDPNDFIIQDNDVSYDYEENSANYSEPISSMTTAASRNLYLTNIKSNENSTLLCLPPSDPFLNKRHVDVQTENEFMSNFIDQSTSQKRDKRKSEDSFLYRLNEPKLRSSSRFKQQRLFRSNSDKELKKQIVTDKMTNSLNFKKKGNSVGQNI